MQCVSKHYVKCMKDMKGRGASLRLQLRARVDVLPVAGHLNMVH